MYPLASKFLQTKVHEWLLIHKKYEHKLHKNYNGYSVLLLEHTYIGIGAYKYYYYECLVLHMLTPANRINYKITVLHTHTPEVAVHFGVQIDKGSNSLGFERKLWTK